LKTSLEPLMSSAKDDWETPDWLFDELNREFEFTLDVAANTSNAKCAKWLGPGSSITEDALAPLGPWESDPWLLETCWMNPPYGRGIDKWMKKANQSSLSGYATTVCLVPARTDTRWWWDYVRYAEVRFLPGRLKFGGATNSAPFPSAVAIFHRNPSIYKPKTVYWEIRGF
jgi:phage N-6-adenine-methyltransferase